MANKKVVTKKKVLKNVNTAVAHIHSTFNNTIVSLADPTGAILCWKSSGTSGYKGTKKGTPFAAQMAAEEVSKIAKEHGVKKAEVKVKGLGSGREAAIRALQANGIEIISIKDVTPIPHNGCRAPKKRRV